MADSDEEAWTNAMNATSSPVRGSSKRPAASALDESDGEDEATSHRAADSGMPPVPRPPVNGNQAVLVRNAAQRKKLRPEQLTDVELFTLVHQLIISLFIN